MKTIQYLVKKKYQITNPEYVTTIENKDYVAKNIPKYNLTKGINEKDNF